MSIIQQVDNDERMKKKRKKKRTVYSSCPVALAFASSITAVAAEEAAVSVVEETDQVTV